MAPSTRQPDRARALRPAIELGDPPSDDVLEELRRADIDGPTVPVMPNDEAPAIDD